MPDKREIRRSVRGIFSSLEAGEQERLGASVVEALRARIMESGPELRTILLYWSLPDEVPTHALADSLLEDGYTVLLPVVSGDGLVLRRYFGRESLISGAFGIQEPRGGDFTCLSEIGLAVVPGRAFSPAGVRIGRGRGYYDRLLPSLSCPKIGVCFPFQLFDALPEEKHDVLMDEVVSV